MGRHADEIAFFAQHGKYLVTEMQVEESSTLNEETNLEVGVGVFRKERLPQRDLLRVVRPHGDHVHRFKSMAPIEPLDGLFIRRQDLLLPCLLAKRLLGFPALDRDADFL